MTPGRRTDATGRVVPIHEARKGRGAVSRIGHRFESHQREADGDALDAERVDAPAGDDELPPLATEVTFEQAGTILAYNESPDLGFDRSINPYRGCEHGCPYCYARPTHSYLNLSPGLDFETRLVAKRNAAEMLEKELAAPAYRPALVNLGSATDAYQPVERELRITRALVEVLARTRHPFAIVTKAALVERDLDLIAPAAALGLVAVFFSLTTLDHVLSRKLEPRAASPQRRLRAIAALAQAGVPVHVNLAPLIPFINEPEIEALLEAAAQAGAGFAHYAVVRLPWEVDPIFQEWLQAHYPDRMQRVLNRIRDMRGGKDYDSRFGVRMKGEGLWADLIRQRFEKGLARFGLRRNGAPLRTDLFVPPRAAGPQLDLF
ncbi:MAG TPA: PA0069 family radical SAM protein [Burkholderiaceae bacterium]|nr:PA0069 family radical SAM protein [Burkholderiaceae bacterium]